MFMAAASAAMVERAQLAPTPWPLADANHLLRSHTAARISCIYPLFPVSQRSSGYGFTPGWLRGDLI